MKENDGHDPADYEQDDDTETERTEAGVQTCDAVPEHAT
jgi:hypothetical protein